MITLIALLPIFALFFLMVIMEKPAYIAGPISLVITSIVAMKFWGMDSTWFYVSMIRGSFIALEIIMILVGTILMIAVLKKAGSFSIINRLIFRFSKDVRVHAIFLAWFGVAFIEGIAGFGTPSMIMAPLMVYLGFSPLAAIVATLIGDGVAVSFGALGVPMSIGIFQGVSAEQAVQLGENFVSNVSIVTAAFHLVLGIFLPLLIICMINFIHERSIKKALAAWKFAIVSGASFTIPYFLIAYLLGPEFPSIFGSVIGALIVIYIIRKKFLLPKEEWIFENIHNTTQLNKSNTYSFGHYFKAFFPYTCVIVLLIITRINIFGIGEIVRNFSISVQNLFGTNSNYIFYPFYSPGFFFFIASIGAFFLYRFTHRDAMDIIKTSSVKIFQTSVALISILIIVQIFIYSKHNIFGYLSIAENIASLLTATGPFWPLFSPILGLFGSFIAGSSTVSNLLFASIQVDAALAVGMTPILGLALQSVGSAVGNMVAIHNVVAASSVVHLSHAEGKVIKHNLLPALVYGLLAGSIGLVITYFF